MMKSKIIQNCLGDKKGGMLKRCRRFFTDRYDVNFEGMWETSDHQKLSSVRETIFGYGDTALTFTDGVDIMKDQFTELGEFEAMPHVVGVHPLIQKITEIDGLRQVVSMQGSLVLKWYEPSLENCEPGKLIPVTQARVPAFPKLSTAINESVEPPLYVVHMRLTTDQPGVVTATYKWKADIEAPFNYRKFPFDKQNPEFVLWFRDANIPSKADYGRFFIPYDCIEQDSGPGVCVTPPTSIAAEWRLFEPVCFSWTRAVWGSSSKVGVQGVKLEIPIVRKSGFYANLMTIQMDLSVLSLCCLVAFPVEELATRISATFTLLVALIAFKFSVGEKLPKVAYTTWFDIYFYLVFQFLFAMAVYFTALKIYKDYYDTNKKIEATPVDKSKKTDGSESPDSVEVADNGLPDPEMINKYGAYAICFVWITANIIFRLHTRNSQRVLEAALGKEILPMHMVHTRFTRTRKAKKKTFSFLSAGKE
eukprot:TRINITY_DN33533_c0_g1_i1.p1 TRINITY_DN33533_c0_g1~~TRINITY_DN33533_c0_g1_i1.p1  ORF type:complete len:477 (+),score=82.45 TRINITY_DN33533_c0_g1_i1:46-1476(+)